MNIIDPKKFGFFFGIIQIISELWTISWYTKMKFTTIISSIVGICITGLGFGYTLTIEPSLATNQNEDTNIYSNLYKTKF